MLTDEFKSDLELDSPVKNYNVHYKSQAVFIYQILDISIYFSDRKLWAISIKYYKRVIVSRKKYGAKI